MVRQLQRALETSRDLRSLLAVLLERNARFPPAAVLRLPRTQIHQSIKQVPVIDELQQTSYFPDPQ